MNKITRRIKYWRWLWVHKQWWFLREMPVREWDTVIFTGLPGAGKTTFAVGEVIRYLRGGVRVYSNVYIRDTFTGLESLPVRTWLDVLRVTVAATEDHVPTLVYLAEIQQMCDARRWQDSPAWWSEMMQQRRHMGLGLMADTQSLSQVEVRLRMLIGRVVQIRPSWLRTVWRRWPVFMYRDLVPEPDVDPRLWTSASRWKRIWQKSHAFHGHSSWELLSGQDFGDLTTQAALKEIADLRTRALKANQVDRLPAFVDDCVAGGCNTLTPDNPTP